MRKPVEIPIPTVEEKEESTSIPFQLGMVRQRSGLIEHRGTERKERASQMWKKKDFS